MNCLSPVVHAHLNHPQSGPLIENTYTVDVASRLEVKAATLAMWAKGKVWKHVARFAPS